MSPVTRGRCVAKRLASLVGLTAGLWLCPASIRAQEQISFQEVLDVNLVNVDVVVVDSRGQLVTDLDRRDFQITDDGKKVEVEYFARLGADRADSAVDGRSTTSDGAAEQPIQRLARTQRFIVFVDLDAEHLASRNRVLDRVSAFLQEHADDLSVMIVTYGGTGLDVALPFSKS